MTTDLARQLFEYDGQPLTVITYHDRPVCIAREFGALLGYGQEGKNLVTKITRDWSDRLVDGKHLHRLAGEELAAFQAMVPRGDGSSPLGQGGLILLTEAGMNLVLILSRQPKAAAIQDWLAEEVMPQLTRDGRYDPSRRVEGPHVVEPVPTPPARDELADLRQRLDLARGLLAELPEDRRAVATEALLRIVVPGLTLPEAARPPLTWEAKRALVTEALEEAPETEDREIARLTGTSHTFVAVMRKRLAGQPTAPQPATRPAIIEVAPAPTAWEALGIQQPRTPPPVTHPQARPDFEKVIAWVRNNLPLIYRSADDPLPPSGWRGRWLPGDDLYLHADTIAEIVGYSALLPLLQDWILLGFMRRDRSSHTVAISIGGVRRSRMIAFPQKALQDHGLSQV